MWFEMISLICLVFELLIFPLVTTENISHHYFVCFCCFLGDIMSPAIRSVVISLSYVLLVGFISWCNCVFFLNFGYIMKMHLTMHIKYEDVVEM